MQKKIYKINRSLGSISLRGRCKEKKLLSDFLFSNKNVVKYADNVPESGFPKGHNTSFTL
jgi:hypothetical protein